MQRITLFCMKTMAIRFPDSKLEKMRTLAELNGTNLSAAIRLAVDCLLDCAARNGGHLPLAPRPAPNETSAVSLDDEEYPEAVSFSMLPPGHPVKPAQDVTDEERGNQ